MKVKDLIDSLKKFDENLEVEIFVHSGESAGGTRDFSVNWNEEYQVVSCYGVAKDEEEEEEDDDEENDGED